MTSIYFPLRTNVHYWGLGPIELDLESRLKLSAILYDELIFEDGGYVALVGPNASLDVRVHQLDQVPEGFFESHSPPEGGEFSFSFGGLDIESPAQRRYQICFRKTLEDIGLLGMPWVLFTDLVFKKPASKEIERLAKQDLKALHNGDFDTYNLHYHTLKNLNYDWMMGSLNGWDLNIDPTHEIFLRQKLSILAEETDTLNPPIDFEVVFPRLPDLSQVPWDAVLETRENPSAVEFRRSLASISQEARQAHFAGESADAIRYHILEWRDDQLIEELEARLTTAGETARKIFVSLVVVVGSVIPPIGSFVAALDAFRDIVEPLAEYAKDRKSIAAAFVRKRRDENSPT